MVNSGPLAANDERLLTGADSFRKLVILLQETFVPQIFSCYTLRLEPADPPRHAINASKSRRRRRQSAATRSVRAYLDVAITQRFGRDRVARRLRQAADYLIIWCQLEMLISRYAQRAGVFRRGDNAKVRS